MKHAMAALAVLTVVSLTPAPSAAQDDSPALRIAAEFGIGIAVMGASVGTGVLIAEGDPFGSLLLSSMFGFAGGFPMSLAIWGVGGSFGGNGGAGWTMLGSVLGGLVSAPIVFFTMLGGEEDTNLWALTAFVLPVIGSILGYELSNDGGESSGDPPPRFGVTPTRDGAMLSVSGLL